MLLHVLIWTTALMLLIQSNIFCIANSVNNKSPEKREIKSAFMLDEVSDFDDVRESEDHIGPNNMLNDISNVVDNLPDYETNVVFKDIADNLDQPNLVTLIDKENLENQENGLERRLDEQISKVVAKSLITPQINVTKEIQLYFQYNRNSTNSNMSTKPSKYEHTSPTVANTKTTDTIRTSKMSTNFTNKSCESSQCIQNLNINQQNIQIIIQQPNKENTTSSSTSYEYQNPPRTVKLFVAPYTYNNDYKSKIYSKSYTESFRTIKTELPRVYNSVSPTTFRNNLFKPSYFNEKLNHLLSEMSSLKKKNSMKRFIMYDRKKSEVSTRNTILKLNEIEDEDYDTGLKITQNIKTDKYKKSTSSQSLHSTSSDSSKILANLEENVEESGNDEKKSFISPSEKDKSSNKNLLKKLSKHLNERYSDVKNEKTKYKPARVFEYSVLQKPQIVDTSYTYDKFSIDTFDTTIASSVTEKNVVSRNLDIIGSYVQTKKALNNQEVFNPSKKQISKLEDEQYLKNDYQKALQEFELNHVGSQPQGIFLSSPNSLTLDGIKSKPVLNYPAAPTYKLNYDSSYFLQPPILNSLEKKNNRFKYFPGSIKHSKSEDDSLSNPSGINRLFVQPPDENYEIRQSIDSDQSLVQPQNLIFARKVEPQIEVPPLRSKIYFPSYPSTFVSGWIKRNNRQLKNYYRKKRRNRYKKMPFRDRLLHSKFEPARKTRQLPQRYLKLHSISKRKCGDFKKNDTDCKNYLNNAEVVLSHVQKLEYELNEKSKCLTCPTTKCLGENTTSGKGLKETSKCYKQKQCKCRKQKRDLKNIQKRGMPQLILPIILANSRVTESPPYYKPVSNVQLQVNPELLQKIELLRQGIESALNPPPSSEKLNNRDINVEGEGKVNPILLKKLDELKQLIEITSNSKRNADLKESLLALQSSPLPFDVTKNQNYQLSFDYDLITKRDNELQEKIAEAKLDLIPIMLNTNSEDKSLFIRSLTTTNPELVKDIKEGDKGDEEYLYEDYLNDNDYLNIQDHSIQKRYDMRDIDDDNINTGDIKEKTLQLMAMEKLLESIINIPFFLNQNRNEKKSSASEPCEISTNCNFHQAKFTLNNINPPFKIIGNLNLTLSSDSSSSCTSETIIDNLSNTTANDLTTNKNESLTANKNSICSKDTITSSQVLQQLLKLINRLNKNNLSNGRNCTNTCKSNQKFTNNITNTTTAQKNTTGTTEASKNLTTTASKNTTSKTEVSGNIATTLSSNTIYTTEDLKNLTTTASKNTKCTTEASNNNTTTTEKTTTSTSEFFINNSTTTDKNITGKTETCNSRTTNADKRNTSTIEITTDNTTRARKCISVDTLTNETTTTSSKTTHTTEIEKNNTTTVDNTTPTLVDKITTLTSSTTSKTTAVPCKTIKTPCKATTTPCLATTEPCTTTTESCPTTTSCHAHILYLHKTCTTTTKKPPVYVFVLDSSSTKEPILYGDIMRYAPTVEPISLKKRSSRMKVKKNYHNRNCNSTANCQKTIECKNESTTEIYHEDPPIDINKERLLLLLNIIRKSSINTNNSTCSATTPCSTTCTNQKCINKRQAVDTTGYKTTIFLQNNQIAKADKPAIKLISLAEHSLQLAEKYMKNHNYDNTRKFEGSANTNTYQTTTYSESPTWPYLQSNNNNNKPSTTEADKKPEDKSEIPDYGIPLYSDLEQDEKKYKSLKSQFYDDLNADYSDVSINEKKATDKVQRLKRDVEVIREIQNILDKMKSETKIRGLKKKKRLVRSLHFNKRSIKNLESLQSNKQNAYLIEPTYYDQENQIEPNFGEPIADSLDLTKDYRKRFLMLRRKKHRKKKERTWKRLFGRSITKKPNHFLNRQPQNF